MLRILDERDRKELESSIGDNVDTLVKKIDNVNETLEESISQNVAALERNIEQTETDLRSSISSTKSTLESTIANTRSLLQTNIDNNVTSQKAYTDQSIAALVNGSPDLLNTLDELAAALGDDANFATTMANQLSTKVDKDGDKVLTDNNLTDSLKSNYDIAYTHSQSAHAPSDAEKNIQSDWSVTDTTSDAYILNKPTLGTLAAKNTVEKSDLSSEIQSSLSSANSALQSFTETDPTVPDWAKASTKPSYTASEVGALPVTTTALKNPYQLTFIGSVSATYDGSEAITITINDASVIYMQVADGYLQYSNDNTIWKNLFAISDITASGLTMDENGVLSLV